VYAVSVLSAGTAGQLVLYYKNSLVATINRASFGFVIEPVRPEVLLFCFFESGFIKLCDDSQMQVEKGLVCHIVL
jgi:hypothetical protein